VIRVALFGNSGGKKVLSVNIKTMLDELYLRRIGLAAEVSVINPSGYIGASIRNEIGYANNTCKAVKYLMQCI
jgi:hypothetical protein